MWKDSETNIDYLNIDHLVNLLKDIISDNDLSPASVGVYGDWGSGKSSLIELSLDSFKEEKNILTVKFNGWLFEGYDDAKSVLLSTILDEIKNNRTISATAQTTLRGLYKSVDKIKIAKGAIKFGADYFLTGGVLTAAKEGIKGIKSLISEEETVPTDQLKKVVQNVQDELNMTEIREDISSFRSEFCLLLKQTNTEKLVVYIDELDRCNPETILETLEAIRLFLFTENTYFIIGADERHIQYSVQRKFADIEGNQMNIGKEYLEKIIQYPVNIHRMKSAEVEFYIFCLLTEKWKNENYAFSDILNYLIEKRKTNILEFDLFNSVSSNSNFNNDEIKDNLQLAKNLSPILSRGMNGNPRQCKRFLNTMESRIIMAKYNSIILNKLVLAKLMLLEYFRQDVFELLLNSVTNGDETSQENLKQFYILEKGNEGTIINPVLKAFGETAWGKSWLKLSPEFHEEDLSPYFYFSRDKIQGVEELATFSFSPGAKNIYSLLVDHTHGYKERVESLIHNIQPTELDEIITAIFTEKINKVDKIQVDDFTSYMYFGSLTSNLTKLLVAYTKMVPFDSLTVGMAPYIIETENKIQDDDFTMLIDDWIEKNTSVSRALQAERGK